MPLYAKVPGPVKLVNVGNGPTITDGIATDFTSANYLKTNKVFETGNNTWEAVFYASTPNISTRQNVMSYTTGNGASVQVGIVTSGNPVVFIYIRDKNGAKPAYPKNSTRTVEANKWYYFRVQFTGTNYFVDLSEDGETWNRYIDVTHSVPINQLTYLSVGWNGGSASEYWRGSIDLNKSYIKIGNNTWYGIGMSRVKVRSGVEKYTIIGSPTLNGSIISNFSSSNYAKVSNIHSTILSDWVIISKAKNSTLDGSQFLYRSGDDIFAIYMNNNKQAVIMLANPLSSVGTLHTTLVPKNTIDTDNWFWLKAEKVGDIVTGYYSTDGITYIRGSSTNVNTSSVQYNNKFNSLNIGREGTMNWKGEIDLSGSSVEVDGKLHWKGSTFFQNLDHYKVHQDNFSKYYTIVGGKLTWANPDIYLKSTGTQYINTEFLPSNDIEFDVKFLTNNSFNASTYGCIFGSRVSSGNNDLQVTTYAGGSTGTFRFGVNTTDQQYVAGITRNKIVKSSFHNLNYCTDIVNYSVNTYNFSDSKAIYLFGLNQNNTMIQSGAGCQIYFAKFNNPLQKKHFVPVPKGLLIGNFIVPSNGMFDIVTQTFYGNAGTGEFTIGGIPNDYIIEGGRMIWCNPDIYLQSSGGQYLSSNKYATPTTRFKIDYQFTSLSPKQQRLCGVYSSNNYENTLSYSYYLNGSGKHAYTIKDNSGGWNSNGTTVNTNRHTFEMYNTNNTLYAYLDGVRDYQVSSTATHTSTNYLYYLVGYKLDLSGVESSTGFIGKVFNIQLNDTNFIQYLVPVPKGILIGDKIAPSNCMFDLVTQTFFENQGTGEFTIGGLSGDYIFVGEDIVWCNDSTYLKCNGAQYFDSGFSANQDTKVVIDYTAVGSGTQALYCSRTNTSLDTFTMFRPITTSSTRFDYNKGQRTISDAPVANTRYKIIADKNKCYIDGVLKYTATESIFQSSYSMIFGCSNYLNRNYDNWAYHKYHNIQLYDDDHLIRYFIPVTTNMQISGTTIPAPGMWDMVTKKFFGNKGTGSFTYGKDS